MDDAQSDLFTDIQLADRWWAVACLDAPPSRYGADEVDAEEASARLFWDIRVLTYLRGNAGDPERSSEAPVRAAALDQLPPCAPSTTGAEENASMDASVSVTHVMRFMVRLAAAPRVLAPKTLRIGCAFLVPTCTTSIKARAPPKDRKPHPARGPP